MAQPKKANVSKAIVRFASAFPNRKCSNVSVLVFVFGHAILKTRNSLWMLAECSEGWLCHEFSLMRSSQVRLWLPIGTARQVNDLRRPFLIDVWLASVARHGKGGFMKLRTIALETVAVLLISAFLLALGGPALALERVVSIKMLGARSGLGTEGKPRVLDLGIGDIGGPNHAVEPVITASRTNPGCGPLQWHPAVRAER